MMDVTVAEAIRELRAQLEIAALEGKGKEIRFLPKTVDIELSITFKKEAEAGGGFKLFSFVDLSAKGTVGDESGHKITLTLEPVGKDGKPPLVGDEEENP